MTAAVSAIPLLFLISFCGFVCLARIDLGHWPVFNDPYPSVIPSGLQRIGISLGVVSFPVATLAGAVLALCGRRCNPDFPMWRMLFFNVTSAVLLLIFI